MHYTCHYCGNPKVSANDQFCASCGAPQPKRSPAAGFFLSILYAVLIYAVMFIVQNGIVFIYSLIVQEALPYTAYFNESIYYKTYWSIFSRYYALVCIGMALLVLLIYVLFYTLRGKRFEREISLSKMPAAPAAAIFVGGAAAQVVISVTISLLSIFFPSLETAGTETNQYYELTFGGGSLALEVLYIAVITPILEEVVFRGLIYTRLRRAMPIAAAQILSALIFGAAHMNLMQFVYATITGLFMAYVFEKYQSIWASILFHIAFNACNYLIAYIPSDMLTYSLYCISIAVVLFVLYFVSRKTSSKIDVSVDTIQQERNPL